MRKITYTEAKSIKKPGMYRAGDTLYLRVGYGEGKSWIQRLTIDGKRHDIGLGSFKLLTLPRRGQKRLKIKRRQG